MATKFYPIIIEPGENGTYGVIFPDFPGCVSAGGDVQEASLNAIEALIAHVEGMIEDEEVLPEPSAVNARVPAWLSDVDLGRSIRAIVPLDIDSRVVRVNVSIEEGLLARVDRVAQARGLTRSSFLAEGARKLLKEA